MKSKRLIFCVFLTCIILFCSSSFIYSDVYVATTTVDLNPDNPVPGSLRWCINNANSIDGSTITFNIPTSDPGYISEADWGYWRISLSTSLPEIMADESQHYTTRELTHKPLLLKNQVSEF